MMPSGRQTGILCLVVISILGVSALDEVDQVIYETTLDVGLYPGNLFTAKLYLHPGIRWFRISLQNQPENEVAFTMRVALDPFDSTGNIIERNWMNTTGHNQLNPPEKHISGLFPFYEDSVFEVSLFGNLYKYEVQVNSFEKFTFDHKATTGGIQEFDVVRIMAGRGTVDICWTKFNAEFIVLPTSLSTVTAQCSILPQQSLCDDLVCILFANNTNMYTANPIATTTAAMVTNSAGLSGAVLGDLEAMAEQFCCLEGMIKDINSQPYQQSLQFAVNITTELFNWNTKASWSTVNQVSTNGPMSLMNRLDDVAQAIGEAATSALTLTAITPSVACTLETRNLSDLIDGSWSFEPLENRDDTISIKGSDLAKLGQSDTKVTVFAAVYSDLADLINKNQDNVEELIVSDVISVTVFGPDGHVSVPVSYTRQILAMPEGASDPMYPVCVFWDYHVAGSVSGGWSDRGCRRVTDSNKYAAASADDYVKCHCNHSTNYAVLMRIVPYDERTSETTTSDKVLDSLTVIGCFISILALLLALAFFFFFKNTSLDTERILIHRNLMGGLLVAMVVFMISTFLTNFRIPCQIVACMLHYLYLAVFSWMLVEGVHLYRLIVTVYGSEKQMARIYYSIGWGLPLLIVIISAAIKWTDYGVPSIACWLNPNHGFIWAFVAPACLIMLVNLVVLGLVIKTTVLASKLTSQDNLMTVKTGLRSSLVLLPMLGITWAIGMVPNTVCNYIFVILNSFQGLWLVIVCCLMNGEVRNAFKQALNKKLGIFSGTVDIASSFGTATSTVSKMTKEDKIADVD